ncbi:MAG: hypothetical protein H6974_15380 [Gammaproteobacteria bacterium]|nr:hypothetical protein [Gammaproteobacteria bacterium]
MGANPAAITDYVVSITRNGLDDVFNAEDLWERAKRRALPNTFLREALVRHPRTRRSRHRPETYFYHVIVRVPPADYDRDERVDDGFHRGALTGDLVELHRQKLGQYIPEGETVRYRIEADPTLTHGQVRFLFGRAIYLPGDEESPAYWLYQHSEMENKKLGVIYPHQRLTLLNGDPNTSTYPVPDWPFSASASVLLIMKPEQVPMVCAEPNGCLAIQPDNARMVQIHDARGARLCVRINPTPLQSDHTPTWTPGGGPRSSAPRLQIVGIALQRLSLHAKAGLQHWRLAFDQQGTLVRCQNPQAVVRLQIDSEDQLWGEVDGDLTRLTLPMLWRPHEGWRLELGVASESWSTHYCGWVRLPQSLSLPVPTGRWFCFGRGSDADLAPGLLEDPDALIGNTLQPVQPEQLMLSRRHVSLRRDANSWQLRLESTTWPVYQLNPPDQPIQVRAITDRSQELPIERGAWLVVGGYILELG